MRRKIGVWLRRLANWIDPPQETTVDLLMPLARTIVHQLNETAHAGSIKWLLAMKQLERSTQAKRRHINAAIDRAVLELHGD